MSVALRLSRGGSKKRPFFRIVAADIRSPRDGRFIERLGTYNPMKNKDDPQRITLNVERIKYWLSVGAKPTQRVQKFLANEKLADKPVVYEQTKQNKPRKKTLEKIKAKEEKEKSKQDMEKAADAAPQPAAADKPAEAAPQPAAADKPAEAAPQPAATDKPAEAAPQPAAADKPAEAAPQPAAADKPAEAAPQPAAADKPAEAAPQPAAADKPAEAAPQPAAADKPAEAAPQPAAADKPAEAAPQPAAADKPAKPHLSPLPRINQLKVKIMVKKNNDKRQAINKKAKQKSIVVAKFGKTFGLEGKLLIHSYFTSQLDILNFDKFSVDQKEEILIQLEKKNKKIYAKIANIETVEEAKVFTGKLIFLNKKYLPKLKPNQFYFSELEQMNVLIDKKKVGYVKHVYNHGAGEYLEIKCENDELLVPFNFDHIEKINPKKKELYLSKKYYEI